MEVIGIGVCTYDLLATVPSIPKIDETTVMLNFEKDIGGPVPIALLGLQKWGVKTALVSKIGGDEYGKVILNILKSERIDISNILIEIKKTSAISFILIDSSSKKRTIIFNPGCSINLTEREVDLSIIDNAKLIHLDALNYSLQLQAAKRAKEKNVLVSLDLSFAGISREFLQYVDILIPNKDTAMLLANEKDPQSACNKLLDFGPKIVAITLGDEGSIVGIKEHPHFLKWDIGKLEEKIIRQEAFKVNVVDTTGAGDIFHGAFIYGIIKEWDLKKTVEFASAVSALNCRKMGGREGIPTLEEVERFIKSG